MTQYRCWVSYETDRPLQLKVKKGWYGEGDNLCMPISGFPAPDNDCWPSLLRQWAKERGIELSQTDDGLTWSVKVKKHVCARSRKINASIRAFRTCHRLPGNDMV